jgi:hypothetical protein
MSSGVHRGVHKLEDLLSNRTDRIHQRVKYLMSSGFFSAIRAHTAGTFSF